MRGGTVDFYILAHNPFCVIFFGLNQSAEVVGRICKCDIGYCSHYPNSTEYEQRKWLCEPAHRLLLGQRVALFGKILEWEGVFCICRHWDTIIEEESRYKEEILSV